MPLQIIRQDITRINCDAVVNPTNSKMIPTGGTDMAIHKAAGKKLLDACKKIGGCGIGETKITSAYKLPCKYIIHTVGPMWDIDPDPEVLLHTCYKNCLLTAKEINCESVAFPLISSGAYGFPKDKVLKIAINAIGDFLLDNEMMVYLAVYDSKAYELSKKLFTDITEYIDNRYILERNAPADFSLLRPAPQGRAPKERIRFASLCAERALPTDDEAKDDAAVSIEDYIKLDKKFAYKLYDLINAKGISTVECYKKANVSKQTWHKIETNPNYKPNKKTVISFAIALNLTLEETQALLRSVGFVLSESSLFDIIIMYCLENKIYDVIQIDSILFHYDQETLYSKA